MTTKAPNPAKRPAKRVVYPNSPLVEVVFEIRFFGEPAVECRRDEFFQLIRQDLPIVWVPNVAVGQAVALQPYHFKTVDNANTVMVALNRFAYSTARYNGFEEFGPRALDLAGKFCKHYGIAKLNRVGLRYINLIPFVREDGVLPWERYFTTKLNVPEALSSEFLNAELTYKCRVRNGAMTTRIACAKTADKLQEAFVLDFDFAKADDLESSRIGDYMAEAHQHTKRVFESIITDDYRAVMRGEVIQ